MSPIFYWSKKCFSIAHKNSPFFLFDPETVAIFNNQKHVQSYVFEICFGVSMAT